MTVAHGYRTNKGRSTYVSDLTFRTLRNIFARQCFGLVYSSLPHDSSGIGLQLLNFFSAPFRVFPGQVPLPLSR